MATILFMRHKPTEEQLADLDAPIIDCSESAGRTLEHSAAALEVIQEWIGLAADDEDPNTLEVYGVFPPILRCALRVEEEEADKVADRVLVFIHEAHNVNRAPDGEKPAFAFKCWLLTGSYRVARGDA